MGATLTWMSEAIPGLLRPLLSCSIAGLYLPPPRLRVLLELAPRLWDVYLGQSSGESGLQSSASMLCRVRCCTP